jgi:hypothetical protein
MIKIGKLQRREKWVEDGDRSRDRRGTEGDKKREEEKRER